MRKHKNAPLFGFVTIAGVSVKKFKFQVGKVFKEKNNFTTSGYSCSPYDDEFCDSSDSSSDLNSTDHYLALLDQVNQQKFRLKSYWKELRLAFDLLYEVCFKLYF